ncbi:TPA: Asp23/Gls24 family envelope stress response protein [Candidatus Acetothermia bacterium]|nr:Asp23/Gls24 family envelope stress response protein [Candidatus Acetothermia bacterium]
MPRDEELIEDIPDEGRISIAKDVIGTIAGLAATSVAGVAAPRGGTLLRAEASRRLVEVELAGNRVKLAVKVGVLYGHDVQAVAQELQTSVKVEVEKMTALSVDEVDVEVVRVVFPEEGRRKERLP